MRLTRLRYLAAVNPSTPEFDALLPDRQVTFMPLETVWSDSRVDLRRSRPKAEVGTGYVRFREGDVLVPKVTPTFQAGRSALVHGLLNNVGAGSTELHVLRALDSVDARFVRYATQTSRFLGEGVAAFRGVAGLQRVPGDFIRDFHVPLVGLEEQRRIADFLDDQVSLLDRVIELRNGQRGLLAERSLSDLSQALAPPSLLQVSDVSIYPWLTRGPHPLVKLGHVCDLQSGITIDGGRTGGQEYAYLRVANVQNGWISLDEVKRLAVAPSQAARHRLKYGDVLMTEGGDLDKLGRGTVWRGQIADCLHQNHIFALRPHPDRLLPDFLALMTRTHHARCYFESTGTRTTNLASTNSSKILAFHIPLPPIRQQMEMVRQQGRQLEHQTEVDHLMERQLTLLEERKGALVTAAVTGEFDVTTARAVA